MRPRANSRRILTLLLHGSGFLIRDDLQSRASLWQKEPFNIHLHMLHSRIGIRHVREGLRYCFEAHSRR